MDNITTTIQNQIPNWTFKADYIETCSCDYRCPCNFNGFPSNGFCRVLVCYHIREGRYGDTILDGLDIIDALSWPKAIHEDNGTHQIFITNKVDQEQRNAIINIFLGKAKGDGPFALFASTIKYLLDPQFVDINIDENGNNSSFSVPGVIDVQLENFKNPVTGEDQDTKYNYQKVSYGRSQKQQKLKS